METTLMLYVAMLVVLAGAAIYLVLRDLGAVTETEANSKPEVAKLPLSGDEPPPANTSDRIDQRLRHLIYESGLDFSPETAFLIMVFFGLLIGGALFIWRDDLLVGVVGFVVGALLPLAYYTYVRRERLKNVREQLPDALDLMARAVRAGETLDQAVESVGASTKDPLGVEFRRCARHLDMGLSVPATMRSLVRRAPIIELRILTAAMNVQRRSGGNMAVTLERLAGVIRDRLSYQRQFMASTGASRMATLLIALAGPAVFAYMLVWQPDYVGNFFALPGGWVLLATAIVLQVVGLTWITGLLKNNY